MRTRFGELLRAAGVEYERDRARYLAIAMIYYAIVSLVPLLLLWALGRLLRVSAVAAAAQREVLATIEQSGSGELRESLDRLLATLLWMNVVSQTLFFGAELVRVTAARRAAPVAG